MAYETDLSDEDRLPWLETVESDEPERRGIAGVIIVALIALAVVAAIAFGAYKFVGGRAADGDGALIAAEEGDYKIKPDDPGGLDVQGEGDIAIATSQGAPGDAPIDWSAVPEAPMIGRRAEANASPEGESGVVPTPAPPQEAPAIPPAPTEKAAATPSEKPVAPPAPKPRATVPGVASGGSLVQLGAFPTEAAANAAWGAIAKRFGYVAGLGRQVTAAEVNGRSLYRLRVDAGSADAAADICGRLTVAGETCFVAR